MANMIPISTVTVGSGGTSAIEFTGIPQIYTDLCIKLSIRSSQSGAIADYGTVYFNGVASNITYKDLYGNGSAAASTGATTSLFMTYQGNSGTANTFGNNEMYIPNYTGSNQKSFSIETVVENNATTAYTTFTSGVCTDTNPVSSLKFTPASGTWQQYSSATLYGIRKY